MEALATTLSDTPSDLAKSIAKTLRELLKLKKALPAAAQDRFVIRVHHSIPFGSAILLDHREPNGRIQIETNVYKAPYDKSFAFEIAPTGSSDFYNVLATGYEELVEDGTPVTPEYLDRKGKPIRTPRKRAEAGSGA